MKKLLVYIGVGLLNTMTLFAQDGDLQEISGYCGKDGENIKWTVNTVDSTLVFEGSGEMVNYGYGESPWTNYKAYIKSVTIKDGILNLTSYAFYSMNVATVELQEGLVSIGENAFRNCSKLENIELPNTLQSIGSNAFASCTELKSINLPNGLNAIGSGAFSYVSKRV